MPLKDNTYQSVIQELTNGFVRLSGRETPHKLLVRLCEFKGIKVHKTLTAIESRTTLSVKATKARLEQVLQEYQDTGYLDLPPWFRMEPLSEGKSIPGVQVNGEVGQRPSEIYLIYGLIDPRDRRIFYVGRTRRELKFRLQEHLNEVHQASLKQRRITEIMRDTDEAVTAVVLEAGIDGERRAFCREVYWMELLLNAGAPLTNASVDLNGLSFLREDTLETRPTLPPDQVSQIRQSTKVIPKSNSLSCDAILSDFEANPYQGASQSWKQDLELSAIAQPLAEHTHRLDMMMLDDAFFMVEQHVRDPQRLRENKLDNEVIRNRRLDNMSKGRLINSGFPRLDEEAQALLALYADNPDLVAMEHFFQRSRISLANILLNYGGIEVEIPEQ